MKRSACSCGPTEDDYRNERVTTNSGTSDRKIVLAYADIPALAQSEFVEDKTVANGSSIGLIFEFEGNRLALLGSHEARQ
jgi:hypothetical protein